MESLDLASGVPKCASVAQFALPEGCFKVSRHLPKAFFRDQLVCGIERETMAFLLFRGMRALPLKFRDISQSVFSRSAGVWV